MRERLAIHGPYLVIAAGSDRGKHRYRCRCVGMTNPQGKEGPGGRGRKESIKSLSSCTAFINVTERQDGYGSVANSCLEGWKFTSVATTDMNSTHPS